MKKLIFGLLALVLCLSSTAQLNDKTISSDDDFKNYIINNHKQLKKAKINELDKIDNLAESLKKDPENTNKMQEYVSILGFENIEQFSDFIVTQDALMNKLREKYQLNNDESSKIKLENSLEDCHDLNFLSEIGLINYTTDGNPCIDACNKAFLWGIAAATAEAVAGHFLCGAVDAAFFIGLVCHGKVLKDHIKDLNANQDKYELCYKKCG